MPMMRWYPTTYWINPRITDTCTRTDSGFTRSSSQCAYKGKPEAAGYVIVEQINGIFQENRSNRYASMKFGTDTLLIVTFWEKGVGHQIFYMAAIFSRWPLFLSNARYVNRSNSDVGITFSENTLLRMFWKRKR